MPGIVLLAAAGWLAAAPAQGAAGPPQAAARAQEPAEIQLILQEAAQLQLGLGMPADAGKAMSLYCRAARLGSRSATLAVASWLLTDAGPDYNPELAANWLHRLQFQERGRAPPRGLALPRCPTEAAGGRPGDTAQLAALVDRLAAGAGVDATLVKAVVAVESSWNRLAVSPAGAAGLMQLMPATASRLDVRDRFDVEQNLRGGIAELRRLLAAYSGNQALALAAYNAGEGAVNRCGCVPDNGETVQYVERVQRLLSGRVR